MTYDDTRRQKFVALRDKLASKFQAKGLQFAEFEVQLVYASTTGANQNTGAGGTETAAKRVTVTPRPTVDLARQTAWENGAQTVIGDAKVIMSRAYSEADILNAAWFEIDGTRYTLSDAGTTTQGDRAELRRAKGGLDWKLYLNRLPQREDPGP